MAPLDSFTSVFPDLYKAILDRYLKGQCQLEVQW